MSVALIAEIIICNDNAVFLMLLVFLVMTVWNKTVQF